MKIVKKSYSITVNSHKAVVKINYSFHYYESKIGVFENTLLAIFTFYITKLSHYGFFNSNP